MEVVAEMVIGAVVEARGEARRVAELQKQEQAREVVIASGGGYLKIGPNAERGRFHVTFGDTDVMPPNLQGTLSEQQWQALHDDVSECFNSKGLLGRLHLITVILSLLAPFLFFYLNSEKNGQACTELCQRLSQDHPGMIFEFGTEDCEQPNTIRFKPAQALATTPAPAQAMATEAANFCSSCGTKVDPTATFCSKCGAPIASAARAEPLLTEVEMV